MGEDKNNPRLLRPELRTHTPTLTDEALRQAIRDRIDQGVNWRTISTLIHVFEATSDQRDVAVLRKPVEDVAHRARPAFWAALSRLQCPSKSAGEHAQQTTLRISCQFFLGAPPAQSRRDGREPRVPSPALSSAAYEGEGQRQLREDTGPQASSPIGRILRAPNKAYG